MSSVASSGSRNSGDPLAPMRQSVARAVERIRELEGERRDLAKQLTGLREELGSLRAEMSRLQERWRSDAAELRRLRVLTEERDEVKERLGRLLNRLDSLHLAQ